MVHLAQLLGAGDAQRAQEMRHVLALGAAGALLLGQPDLLLGDRGEGVEAGQPARDGDLHLTYAPGKSRRTNGQKSLQKS